MTNREQLLQDGYIKWDAVVPLDLCQQWTDRINGDPRGECFKWDDALSLEFRAFVRSFLESQQMAFEGWESDLGIFNRPAGGQMYWHDDDGGGRPDGRRVACCVYLTETPIQKAPLKVIPNSHRGGYEDLRASFRKMRLQTSLIPPYQDYKGNAYAEHPQLWERHPDELVFTSPPGTIIVTDERIIHGTPVNRGPESRTMVLWWLWKTRADRFLPGG